MKLHDSIKAMVGEGLQGGATSLMSQARHPVALTAVFSPRAKVY